MLLNMPQGSGQPSTTKNHPPHMSVVPMLGNPGLKDTYGGGGINWDIGIDIYTLLYIK